jgi:hypothetical protein
MDQVLTEHEGQMALTEDQDPVLPRAANRRRRKPPSGCLYVQVRDACAQFRVGYTEQDLNKGDGTNQREDQI